MTFRAISKLKVLNCIFYEKNRRWNFICIVLLLVTLMLMVHQARKMDYTRHLCTKNVNYETSILEKKNKTNVIFIKDSIQC